MESSIWNYFLNFFISTLLAALLRPKQKNNKPQAVKFSDFNGPTNNSGRPISKVYGRAKQASPHLIWWGNYRTQEVVKKIRGTFGIGGSKQTMGYNYYVSMALGLCQAGENVRLKEIWADDKKVWSGDIGNGGSAEVNAKWGDGDLKSGIKGVFKFYSGNTNQDAHLVDVIGSDNVPNYKQLAYVVFGAPTGGLGDTGVGADPSDGWVGSNGGVPQLAFVVQALPSLAETGLEYDPRFATNVNVGGDENLAYIIAELATNPKAGAGVEPVFIDSQSFHDAAEVFKAEGNSAGFLWDSQRNADDVIQEIGKQGNCLLVPDQTTGKLRLKLIRSTDEPALTLNESNIVSLEKFTRTALDEATNEYTVQYIDTTDWQEKTIICQDLGAIQQAGMVISQSINYAGPNSQELASKLGVRDLRSASTPLASATLTVNEPGATRLTPGDLVAFNWPKLGIANMRCRVMNVNVPRAHRQQITLDLLQDVFTSGRAIYSSPELLGGTETATAPGAYEWATLLGGLPYGITGNADGEAWTLLVSYPSTNQQLATGYRTVWWTKENQTQLEGLGAPLDMTEAEWQQGGPVAFAAKGTIASDLAATSPTGTLTLTVFTEANAYAIEKNEGRAVVAYTARGELLLGTATLAPTRQSATFNIQKRGIYGTEPQDYTAGGYSEITFLYGYTVDDQPIIFDSAYPGDLAHAYHARPLLIGPGGDRLLTSTELKGYNGTVGSLSRYAQKAYGHKQTAGKPYAPGNLRLDGVAGIYLTTNEQGGAPVTLASPSTLAWVHRNKKAADTGGYSDYFTGDGAAEPGITYEVGVAYRLQNTPDWTEWHTETTAASSLQLPAITLPTGTVEIQVEIRCMVLGFYSGTSLTRRWTYEN